MILLGRGHAASFSAVGRIDFLRSMPVTVEAEGRAGTADAAAVTGIVGAVRVVDSSVMATYVWCCCR
jgi:hypothetical protein